MTDLPEKPRSESAVERALKAQRAFEEARPTRLGRGAEKLTAPLSGLLGKLVSPSLVRQGLDAADRLAGMTLPKEITGHDTQDIAACDSAALRVQAWAAGTNAATGGAAGWFGAAGLAADIPATIALAARNVRATGAAYGFLADNEDERAFRSMVLQVATAQAEQGRDETISNLNQMARWLNSPSGEFSQMARWLNSPEGRLILEKGGDWVSDKVVERVARQLGVSLAGRKAGQLVPVVGGAVAAVVNASFQTDVSRAARYAYRQRWLMARHLLPAPEAEPEPEAGADA